MTRYINRYGPAILNSVRQAIKTATTSVRIPMFFQARLSNGTILRRALEERQHTRIRNLVPKWITDYDQDFIVHDCVMTIARLLGFGALSVSTMQSI